MSVLPYSCLTQISVKQAKQKKAACASYHRHGEADGDHDNVVQHHEELATQVAGQRWAHVPGGSWGLLVPFDLQLVPVAHKHCVDVVHEVGNSKHDVSAGQPVPVQRRRRLTPTSIKEIHSDPETNVSNLTMGWNTVATTVFEPFKECWFH